MEYDHDSGYYVDGWDGYVHSRKRLFEHLYLEAGDEIIVHLEEEGPHLYTPAQVLARA